MYGTFTQIHSVIFSFHSCLQWLPSQRPYTRCLGKVTGVMQSVSTATTCFCIVGVGGECNGGIIVLVKCKALWGQGLTSVCCVEKCVCVLAYVLCPCMHALRCSKLQSTCIV